jgi:hypothetical protein
MRKPAPDFARVEPHQLDIHERLRNWSRWVSVQPARQVSSMFRLYRPPQHWEEKAFREPCDLIDAQRVEKLVCGLPGLFKSVLRWYYVAPTPVWVACKAMGHSESGLHKVLRDARQAMINLLA